MSTAVIPEPIAQLQLQLDQIRNTQPRAKRLPDSVWQAAVELAREHGVYSVAHHLRLDYTGLKRRLGGVSHRRRKARKLAFVELMAPQLQTPFTYLMLRGRLSRGLTIRGPGKGCWEPRSQSVPNTSASVVSFATINQVVSFPSTGNSTVDATGGLLRINIPLPDVSTYSGRSAKFIKSDSGVGSVVISAINGQLINDQPTWTLTNQWQYVVVESTGTAWRVFANN